MGMDSSLFIGQASAMARKQCESKVSTKLYERLIWSSKDTAKQQNQICVQSKQDREG